MNKIITLSSQEARHKEQAAHSLAESQRILRELATERRRAARQRATHTSLITEGKVILQGA